MREGGGRKKEAHPWLQTEFLRSNPKKNAVLTTDGIDPKPKLHQKKNPQPNTLRETQSLETKRICKIRH